MAAKTAFVLGGGGVLGASEVGMLKALLEAGVVPDLVVGTSVGALNGAFVASDPSVAMVDRLAGLWGALTASEVFSGSLISRIASLARSGTHLHANESLRSLIDDALPGVRIEDLEVPFECVAACIERACAHWFSSGPVADAVLASSAVPGLLPPVEIDGEHFVDGGLVNSIPVGRAVELGATRVFVLHVGRIERPLTVPTKPWEVGLVSFEISRRHRFSEEMARMPPEVEVRVLPAGAGPEPTMTVRYRSTAGVPARIEQAYTATASYLDRLPR